MRKLPLRQEASGSSASGLKFVKKYDGVEARKVVGRMAVGTIAK